VATRIDPTERFSFLSHAAGAVVAAVGTALLLAHAPDALALVAVAVYGASLVVLFTFSALHHAIHPASERGRRVFRRMDHIAIYALIAGTYTAVALAGLRGAWGWTLAGLVWGLATLGVLLKVFWLHAPRGLSTALFVAIGWSALVAVVPLVERFPPDGLALLLAGGLVYSGGAAIYALRRPDPWPRWLGFHGLWHVLVLAGAGLQFAFVAGYVLVRP